jgi:hypothetical protein
MSPTSSEESSAASEGLLHYEFENPHRASTPKSSPSPLPEPSEEAAEPHFEFAAPSDASWLSGAAFESHLDESSLAEEPKSRAEEENFQIDKEAMLTDDESSSEREFQSVLEPEPEPTFSSPVSYLLI